MGTLEKLPAGAFTQSEAARAGVDSRTLYRLRDSGHILWVSRGLFRLATAPIADLDLLEIVKRRPQATVCLASALAHHGLIDAIPSRTQVAIPRGQSAPATMAAVRWHSFDRETFLVGREEMSIPGTDERIGLYSAERSLVDVFRLRGSEGYETGIEALKAWLKRNDARPAALLELSRKIPRALGPVKLALAYLS
jgi:predicted transcriptional regulator of viral defense system